MDRKINIFKFINNYGNTWKNERKIFRFSIIKKKKIIIKKKRELQKIFIFFRTFSFI